MDLRDDGILGDIRSEISGQDKDPDEEIRRLYTSKTFQAAYLKFAQHMKDIDNVSQALREQYPMRSAEISIDDMGVNIRRALSKDGQLPNTVVVLDELQQFIGDSLDTALQVQDVVEACSKQLDGKVLFIGTGQSALTDTPALQKLMGRFTIKVHLRDNDVERVVRTVVLEKKPERRNDIDKLFTTNSGEVSRQLKATKIATVTEDGDVYAADYPLLPVRRRFWREVLRNTDPSGTAAQMRTQLRVTHEAVKSVAEQEVGAIIPGDFLYDQLANTLVMSGEMQKRFQEIIEEQLPKPDGELRRRVCAAVFMINKLPRGSADIGIRANDEHLSDLLARDLEGSATELRAKLPDLLENLRKEGTLMEVDGEYRLQTTEGARWEQEFQARRSPLFNDQAFIARERGQLLDAAITKKLGNIATQHGQAKVQRKAAVHYGAGVPQTVDGPIVWVRDGFQETESVVVSEIQSQSLDDATIHVLIPRSHVEDLRAALASSRAAEEAVNFMGSQSSGEGEEAAASMASRLALEDSRITNTVDEIVRSARVFLSGGQELTTGNLDADVRGALDDVLGRLFPKFSIADSAGWHTVWRRAKEGSGSAFEALDYDGDPDKHPVAVQVMKSIGAGKKGRDLVSLYSAAPFGWPKDAIDATLVTLLVSGHLAARLNGKPTSISELDQKKIGQADFKVQHPVLTPKERLTVRKLFQKAGHPFTSGEDEQAAYGFVITLKGLIANTGGEPPAPRAEEVPELAQLEGKSGNDLLFELHAIADALGEKIDSWKQTADMVSERAAEYLSTKALLESALNIPGVQSHADALAALQQNRSLLAEPNPVASIKSELTAVVRDSLNTAHADFILALEEQRSRVEANPSWAALSGEKQSEFLKTAGVIEHPAAAVASEEDLISSLQTRNLDGWKSETDALSARFDLALAMAIKELEPTSQVVKLPKATIHDTSELENWLDETRKKIEPLLNDGPVVL